MVGVVGFEPTRLVKYRIYSPGQHPILRHTHFSKFNLVILLIQ